MERDSIWPFVVSGSLLAFSLGGNLGIATTKHDENAEGRVHEVQLYNEQIHEQLQPTQKIIAHLVLKDRDNKTYSFETVNEDEKPEVCTGSYEVKNKHATITGKLACTTTVAIS